MKMTFDLPADLVRQLKIRAIQDGRKLKDAAAEVLRAGLTQAAGAALRKPPEIRKDAKTGLPVIQCRRAAPRGQELTPDRIAQVLSDQEAGWARDFG